MKSFIGALFMIPILSMAQRPVIYNLPDANLRSDVICGKPRVCDPGSNRGIVYRFAKNPFSPEIDDNSTPQTIAASILGQAVSVGELNSEELIICSGDGITSLITANDVTASARYGTNGRSFNYNVKKKLTIDVKAAAQSNIDELIKRSSPSRQQFFESIRAELEAVYNNLKNNELIITANYSEWSLKQTAINRIKNAPEFQACRDKILQKNLAYLTDIGLISYNISLNGATVRRYGVDINTKLKREGLNIDIGALIEREVHKTLTAQTVQGYQVIGWRKSNTL